MKQSPRLDTLLAVALVAFALALGGLFERATRSVWAQDDSQNGSEVEAGRYVVIGIVLYDRQTGQEVIVYNGASYATATPRPPVATATPSATPTVAPPPSSTPVPTVAPADPTPTPEATALPTLPPSTGEKACRLRTRSVRINERTAPSLSAARTATSPIDTYSTLKVDQFAVADGFLWAREALGWFAARDMAAGEWWVDGASDSLDCSEVEGWPAGLAPPAPIVRLPGVGWTLTLGYDSAIAEVGDTLRGKGYMPSVTLTSNAGESCLWAARGWRVLVRPWYVVGLGDDPDLSLTPEASARARVQALEWYVPLLCPGHDEVTVQLVNETTWPSASYLNRWIVAACAECEARGWTCAPVMFSVGTPELDWMPALRPALTALAEGQHALGYNVYGYARDVMLCDMSAAYTVWRVKLLRIAAGDAPWPRVMASEAARGAGDVPPDVSDAACFVRQAAGVYDDVMLWYSGGPSAWSGGRWYADAIRALVSIL